MKRADTILTKCKNANPNLGAPDDRQDGPPLIYDESVHDYSVHAPVWNEIEPGHFVLGNEPELEKYRSELAEG